MNSLVFKISTGIAAVSLFALAAAPVALADTGADVSGNGAFSKNTVKDVNNQQTNVTQTNNTDISNKVTTNQNTGNNSASFNTGGSVTIQTGNANATTNINNQAGSNTAKVEGGGNGSTAVDVSGNGAFSKNNTSVQNTDTTKLTQTNTTDISNKVTTNQNTGGNSADFNTGTNVTIGTGDANATTNISNQANQNFATVDNGKASNDSLVGVQGNGAFSKNNVSLTDNQKTNVNQNNSAWISNYVKTNQNTGNNTASFNTGGSVYINTGSANSDTNINNQAGQNFATVYNGGGLGSVWADISGNGAFSRNGINLYDNNSTSLNQRNTTWFYNDVKTNQNTGRNYADFNTGGDTSISTGGTNSSVNINNQAGSNRAFVGGYGDWGNGNNTWIDISGNGAFSRNKVNDYNNSRTNVRQNNYTDISNKVYTRQNTGNNFADFNTGYNSCYPYIYDWGSYGSGSVSVNTGDTNSWTTIGNQAGRNAAVVFD